MKKTRLLPILETFLYTYLPQERGRGTNTILSYAYAFQLLFEFWEEHYKKEPLRMSFGDFKDDTLCCFLIWLETSRNNSVTTRNQRLSALKAFSAYLEKRYYAVSQPYRYSAKMAEIKKGPTVSLSYFTQEEIKTILNLPFSATNLGKRDRVMLSVLYASGARVQELCDMKACDLLWNTAEDKGCLLTLYGKGGKVRVIRISPKCTALLKVYLEDNGLNNPTVRNRHIFSSQTHEHMTPSCVSAVVNKYVKQAKMAIPTLFPEKRYSPHSFRHSVATHMLAAKVSLPTIKNFLGHESIQSTLIYTRVTAATIDEALAEYWKSQSVESNGSFEKTNAIKNGGLVLKARQMCEKLSE